MTASSRLAVALLVTFWAFPAAANSLKDAELAAEQEMKSWVVIPKFDLGIYSKFTVKSDGWPVKGKKQGGMASMGYFDKATREGVCVRGDQRYRFTSSLLVVKKKQIYVLAFDCKIQVEINLDRKVTPEDLAPAALATAIGGVLAVEGISTNEALVLSELEDAMEVMQVDSRRSRLITVGFDTPPGEAKVDKAEDQMRFSDGDTLFIAEHRDLRPEEQRAEPRLLLQESLPLSMLSSIRKKDKRGRITTIGALEQKQGLVMAWADASYLKYYERVIWVLDTDRAKLYTLSNKGPLGAASRLAETSEAIGASLSLATDSPSDGLASDLPMPEDSLARDLPTPLGTPAGALNSGGQVDAQIQFVSSSATPVKVTSGSPIRVTTRFAFSATRSGSLPYTEERTIRLNGSVVPNYPMRKSSSLAAGEHTSILTESVPANATSGVYECETRICIASNCRSDTVMFEVL